IGEATTEYHELAVKAQVETELRSRLLGLDPTDVERIWQLGFREFWWRRGVVHTSAMSGIDQALWDIAGKAAGLPVFRMLGGKVRDRVRCYIRNGPEFEGYTLDEAARATLDMGFDAFKCGWGPLTEPYDMARQAEIAVEEHTRLRELLGPDTALMIDAAGMFDPQVAHRLIEGLRPLNMHFVEEPTNMDTVEPTLRLKRDFPDIPIAVGERLITRWDFRPWFEAQAIDVCQADISHAGGISEMMKIAHVAEVYGITIAPHNPYGPVALAAAAHVAATIQNFNILEHCPMQPWFDRVQAVNLPLRDGYIHVDEMATRPGLGVELDMDFVRSRNEHEPCDWAPYVLDDGSLAMQ
ncbi:MAG: mandelate racemase/muconate lactonizing enzyme family protein, partial [Phycisphaeraceae bacterium]|nr:mandelate racemase/muconate lactonizing enzyme family protein [Phycisphaeraceae bacterium]